MRQLKLTLNTDVSPHAGTCPKVQMIPVSKCYIDDRYQRPVKLDWVKEISADFDWQLFGVIDVAKHSNGFAVIDGQQRLHAAMLLGITSVPAIVRIGGTSTKEADTFVKVNTSRRGITQHDKYRAGVTARYPIYLRIQELFNEYEYIVAPGRKHKSCSCPTALVREYTTDKDVADDCLVAILTIGYATDNYNIKYRTFSALCGLEGHIRKLDPDATLLTNKWLRKIKKIGLEKLEGDITRMEGAYGKASRIIWTVSLCRILNKGQRTNLLPEPEYKLS